MGEMKNLPSDPFSFEVALASFKKKGGQVESVIGEYKNVSEDAGAQLLFDPKNEKALKEHLERLISTKRKGIQTGLNQLSDVPALLDVLEVQNLSPQGQEKIKELRERYKETMDKYSQKEEKD